MGERSERWVGGIFIGLTAIGLAVSVLLVWEYRGEGGVCSIGGGCDEVRNSAFATIAGVPTPIIGAIFFATAAFLVAGRSRWLRWLLPLGGAAGAAFLLIQWRFVGAFCPWCVAVDLAAIALAFFSSWASGDKRRSRRFKLTAIAAPLAASVALLLLVTGVEHDDPAAALPQAGGRVTVTEFVDFECPYCRQLHRNLSAVLADFPEIVVQRKHVPLPQHPHAEIAARAACCADEVGYGEPMANRLFAADRLDRTTCIEMAADFGIDRETFEGCLESPRIDDRLAADRALAQTAGVNSLPTLLVGNERLVGAPSEARLRTALVRATR